MKKLKANKTLAFRRKRNIVAVSLLGLFAVIGGVIAYSSDQAFFRNLFGLGECKTEFIEDFTSPENWNPGETVDLEMKIKSKSKTTVTARFKYEEYWLAADDQTQLDLEKDGIQLALVTFQNQDDWELKDDGWYYYKDTLENIGDETNSYFKSVTLNPEANFGTTNVCTETNEGQVCEKPNDEYEHARYHLKITAQTICGDFCPDEEEHIVDCDSNNLFDKTACMVDTEPVAIDFRKGAPASGTPAQKNGNGIQTATENGKTVYYYRGQLDYNYVLWSGFCWRIVRTTYTGGTKIVYAGEPTNGVCPDGEYDDSLWPDDPYAGMIAGISTPRPYSFTYDGDTYGGDRLYTWTIYADRGDCWGQFGSGAAALCIDSYADAGYIHGNRAKLKLNSNPDNGTYVFGHDVSYQNGTYTLLDTVSGATSDTNFWSGQVLQDHHYTCWSTGDSCATVSYISNSWMHFELSGGDNLTTLQAALTDNSGGSSFAKDAVDYWYQANLSSHANDLEDAIYCGDRTLHVGTLHSLSEGLTSENTWTSLNYPNYYDDVFESVYRNTIAYDNNLHPTYDCNKSDAYTVGDSGNGALQYPIGLLSQDEATFAADHGNMYTNGLSNPDAGFSDAPHFLDYIDGGYTMTPFGLMGQSGDHIKIYEHGGSGMDGYQPDEGVPGHHLFPVVSLKQSKTFTRGDGTRTNPYVVE